MAVVYSPGPVVRVSLAWVSLCRVGAVSDVALEVSRWRREQPRRQVWVAWKVSW